MNPLCDNNHIDFVSLEFGRCEGFHNILVGIGYLMPV